MLYIIADYVDDASETVGVTVSVVGGRNVAGTVRVDGEVYFFNQQGEFRRSPFVVTINKGHNTGTGRSESRQGTPYSTGIENISPSRDGTYRYLPDDSESPTPTPTPDDSESPTPEP
ncbi:MAG: hypothetical protein LBL07_18630 [Tannerella sp.]|jgi:hypothetical protein|nr:hypothetical protein [Tannerella sp.]